MTSVPTRVLGILIVLALAVTACTPPPPPPPPSDPLTAGTDPGSAAALVSLAPGEWSDYRLVLDAVRSAEVVYAELGTDQAAAVELRSGVYWSVVATSTDRSGFVRGRVDGVPQPTPAGTVQGIGSSAISVEVACRGPCVIFDPGSANFYLRVVNLSTTRLEAPLYLYGADLTDTGEPANDSTGSSVPLESGTRGAIELLGDVDHYRAQQDAAVTITSLGGLGLSISVYDTCGIRVSGPHGSGAAFRVYAGDTVAVRAAGDRAGPSAASGYVAELGPASSLPPRDPGCVVVRANTDPGTPVGSVFLGTGGVATFVVEVPATVAGREAIQLEVAGSATLEVLDGPNGAVAYSSSSPDVFRSGDLFLAGMEPSAVEVQRTCSGPCVIDRHPADSYIVRVRNRGAAREVPLFAFGRSLDDGTEPANDARASAPVLGSDASGAVETVGDVDFWYVASDRGLTFESVSGLPLVAHVVGASGTVVAGPYRPGDSFLAYSGEFVRVRAVDASTAGVSGSSTYYLY